VIELIRQQLGRRRTWFAGLVGLLVVIATVVAWRSVWSPQGAVAQAPAGRRIAPMRVVPVEVAKAVKQQVPLLLEALGNVTTIASVAIRTRIDSEVVAVHFADGAKVNAGDVLFTLDSRAIEAQIRQVEGNIARDRAQLDGAERDVRRYADLVAKGATPQVNLDNAITQVNIWRAALQADQAALESLKVQLSYCVIRAPISGRISSATAKVGSIVRQADATPLATINQIAPIYASFAVPQHRLPDVRRALAAETATVEAIIAGERARSSGQVTMIENAVDPATGMVMIRATMPNTAELLWPGMLVTVRLTLGMEEAVLVPAAAVQVSQAGTFVFVVQNGAAVVRPVKVARSFEQQSVIEAGLQGGEAVVVSGQLLLTNGTRVEPREMKAGS